MTRNNSAPSDDIKKMIIDHGNTRKKHHVVRWIILCLVIVIGGWGLFFGFGKKEGETVTYVTQPVERGDLTIIVTASGTLKPTNQVDIGSEVSGTVRTVMVDYNDQVTAGQVLAKLDSTAHEARVMQARAALKTAQAKLNEARVTVTEQENSLKRLRELRKLSNNKAMSDNDIETVEANVKRALAQRDMAEAQIVEAEAALRLSETDLGKTVIYSPIEGLVLSRAVEPGQTVAASLQAPVLFTLAEDLKKMELHVDVDEADVGSVKEGQQAVFTVDAYPGKKFPARISQVRYAAQTVGGVVTYETVLTVDNSDLLLRPGMTATADIVVKEIKNALLVPNAALRFSPERENRSRRRGGLFSALMPRLSRRGNMPDRAKDKSSDRTRLYRLQEGTLVPVMVKIGDTDGRMTEILEGDLTQGTPMVTDTAKTSG